MYAVLQNGGKQYRVNEGQIVRLEKLDVTSGKTIEFEQVMMIVDDDKINIGTPFLKNNKIVAEIIAHGRSNKLMVVKFKRRKHYRKRQGHRQSFTDVKIINIKTGNKNGT